MQRFPDNYLEGAQALVDRWLAQNACRRTARYAEMVREIQTSGRVRRAESWSRQGYEHVVYPAHDLVHADVKAWLEDNVHGGWRFYASGMGAEYGFADANEALAFRMRWS